MPREPTSRSVGQVILDYSLLLVTGTLVALFWANIDLSSYERLTHPLHFWVNDVGMVFFFALAAKEIVEASLPGGPLASPREAAVPILAAVGGMAGPASLYVGLTLFLARPELMPGWAIPCATDIAFSYMAARFIFPSGHPAIPFLLLLAIADDALGLLLLAVFYPTGPISLPWLAGLMVLAVGVARWLKARRVGSFWAYTLIPGALSWAALFFGGFHPALAMVPVLPFMPHAERDRGVFEPSEHLLPDTMNRFEHWWRIPVHIILFFFGLANAGVAFSSFGSGSWIVFGSLLVGKPVGILLLMFVGLRLGLRAPGGLSYAHAIVLGLLAAVGFTVSLFFSTAAFEAGPLQDEVKMGALLSFAAIPAALLLARALGVRTFVSGNT